MRTVVNGKLVEIDEHATAAELKVSAGVGRGDSLVRISGSRAEALRENDKVESGARYRSIPPLVQG